VVEKYQIGVIPYYSLVGGFLTDKYSESSNSSSQGARKISPTRKRIKSSKSVGFGTRSAWSSLTPSQSGSLPT